MEIQLPSGHMALRQSPQYPLHSVSSGQFAAQMATSICPDDATLEPFVSGCRRDFDFTLLFEEITFSIIPSACFLTLSAYRIWSLRGRPRIEGESFLKCSKLVSHLRLLCGILHSRDSIASSSRLLSLQY